MPLDSRPARGSAIRRDCLLCPVQTCLARDDATAGVDWAGLLSPRQAVLPGAPPLCEAGVPLRALYSVRAGCLKTYTVDAEGKEHIRGFHLPGDLFGLDALYGGRHVSSAAAVMPSQVCAAPVAELHRAMTRSPALGQRLAERASRELALALAIGGGHSAEQRMAAFLGYMEARLGAPNGVFRLPMPQRDIGNYLRLATETVCRTLKRFARDGLIETSARGLRIAQRPRLMALAQPVGLDPATRPPLAVRASASIA